MTTQRLGRHRWMTVIDHQHLVAHGIEICAYDKVVGRAQVWACRTRGVSPAVDQNQRVPATVTGCIVFFTT
jgi:hypothetical protein